MPKTPALTTATACSRALTGVGATIAIGSQPCSGMIAALTPKPIMKQTNSTVRACRPAVIAEDAGLR